MVELGQILTGLVQRTTDGKLTWKRSVPKERFVTSVDAISIAIVTEFNFSDGDTDYRLDILDESGDTVESLGPGDTTPEQYQQLARLYVLARRSAPQH